ncbi:GGDEF domain-containing protein [Photobacterium sp. 1_MG-2023]|uniref:GGDEF domain-containing protein n=1 Tax=Photobacterium sp. 1_MG-2023 TaxID=3062646 RepID=UPI0026E35CB0|nr:GGDEF domain-containing protein [Photobacterium sp. 1_MG-2023]MDO6707039.1 GGDEF domain-containing protein [Photobacterium sp. 1_MG-2023]
MKKISQLPTGLTIFVCFVVLATTFIPMKGNLETITSSLTLALIFLLVREVAGKEMKFLLILSASTYGLGVIADLLDEIPELATYWLLVRADNIFSNIGVFLLCFCFIKILDQRHELVERLKVQIAKSRELELELSRQALQDDLTGLQNRRSLFRRFDNMAINLNRGMMAYIDIDNFKQVNDRMGHHQGDLVLIEMAHILFRHSPTGSQIYRIGGDEFIVLLPSEDQTLCQEWLDQILEKTRELRETFHLGISVGLVPFHPGNLSDPDMLLAKADTAMYEEKEQKSRV